MSGHTNGHVAYYLPDAGLAFVGDAVFALGDEDDLVRLVARVEALQAFLNTEDGANLLAGYRAGVRLFDVALGGLGGCPFVPGAGGNVATEEAAERFASLGVPTGLDVQALAAAADHTARLLGRPLHPPSGRGSD